MIEPGVYKTKMGVCAHIIGSKPNGAVGWVHDMPMAWDVNGRAIISDTCDPSMYDLDLSRTITIHAELPEPELVWQLHFSPYISPGSQESFRYILSFRMEFTTRKAAEAWREWWRKQVLEGREK